MVVWPHGFEGGRVLQQPLSSLDFLPTVAAAVGIDVKLPLLDGENALPMLTNDTAKRRGALFFDYPARERADTWRPGVVRQTAVIDGDWKLLSMDGESPPALQSCS